MRTRILVPALLALTGCDRGPTPVAAPAGPPSVKALSPPVGWLVERIGEGRTTAELVLPAGESADAWSPPGEVVAALSDADLIVANGAGYEAWTKTATLPTARLVDSARGLDLIHIDGRTHSHGKAGEHSHTGVDPHTWTDPAMFAGQAAAVHGALVRLDPAGKDVYDRNLTKLKAELEALGSELDAALAPARGRTMIANHPSFGYLARRTGLDLSVVDLDPEAPVPADSVAPGALVWWEAQPSQAALDSLPEGVESLFVDPIEQPGAGGTYDYLAQSRANVARFREAFPAVE